MAEPLSQNPPSVAFVHLPGHPLAGKLTREAWLFLQQVMQRIGGSVALTPEELAIIVEQVQAGAADVTLQPTPPDAEAVALPPHWHALPPPSPAWWPEVSPGVPPAAPWGPDVLPPLAAPSDAAAVAIVVGASPFTYTPPIGSRGMVVVAGGNVTAIAYNRRGVATGLGVVAGPVEVSPGDTVTVTYAVAPTMTYVPR
jgi:hypothetical protein